MEDEGKRRPSCPERPRRAGGQGLGQVAGRAGTGVLGTAPPRPSGRHVVTGWPVLRGPGDSSATRTPGVAAVTAEELCGPHTQHCTLQTNKRICRVQATRGHGPPCKHRAPRQSPREGRGPRATAQTPLSRTDQPPAIRGALPPLSSSSPCQRHPDSRRRPSPQKQGAHSHKAAKRGAPVTRQHLSVW